MGTNGIAAIGYLSQTLGFAALAVLFLRRRQIWPLAIASAASALAGVVFSLQALNIGVADVIIVVAEWARYGAWIIALLFVLRTLDESRIAEHYAKRFGPAVLLVAGTVLASYSYYKFGSMTDSLVMAGGILGAIFLISTLEQIYRNLMSDSRSSLEYICVALFLIAAYDVLLFFRGISTGDLQSDTWVARGFVNALVVPVLGVAGWRSTIDRVVDIRRPVAFYISWLLVLGIGMTVWLFVDFYVIAIEQYWGNVATIVGVAATLLAVCILLLSGTIRGGTRVFLRKVLFPYKYDYRKEWLRFVGTLSESKLDHVPRTVVRAVAPIVNSPGGIVWIQNEDDDDYLPVDAWHCDVPTGQSISRDSQLVRFLHERQWIIDFNELEARPKLYDDLALDPWFKSRSDFWLVVPLFLGKQLLGMIVLLKPAVMPSLNFEDHDLLRTVGRHIATHIKQAELDKRLAESRQFGAYNRLTAFLMHDLNNLIAQQSLVVKNAEKHRHDPKFVDDTIDTIANSVARMNRLMEQLTSASKAPQVRRTDLRRALKKAVERSKERGHVPSLDIGPDPIMLEADSERLTSIFEHLIRNAQDATDQNGRIDIKTTVSESTVQVSIRDNGRGMDSEFIRERLFRPFDSTKGRNSMGIGAYQARDYVRTLGGQMDVSSQVQVGTEFLINLPLAD